MDLDKIIRALEICASDDNCTGCPYREDHNCSTNSKRDAVAAIKELQQEVSLHETGDAFKAIIGKTPAEAITTMQDEIDAQSQAIETLQAINTRLEGKVEAYEYALRLAIE